MREPWRWRTHADLAGQGLRAMAEGADGRMWFGTSGGAVVYDGVDWQAHPLEIDGVAVPVNHVLATAAGAVYAASPRGLFVDEGGAWVRVFPDSGPLENWFISDLEEAPDGSVWAATALGALQLEGGRSRLYTTADAAPLVTELAPAAEVQIVPAAGVPEEGWSRPGTSGLGLRVVEGDHIAFRERGVPRIVRAVAPGGPADRAGVRPGDWIVAVDGRTEVSQEDLQGAEGRVRLELRRATGASETLELTAARIPGRRSVAAVHDILVLPGGGLALGMQSGGVVLRSGGEWTLLPDPTGGTGHNPRLAMTGDGTLRMIFQDLVARGIFSMAPGGRSWSEEKPFEQGLIQMCLTVDRSGDLWIGGHQGNLAVRRDGRWVTYSDLDLPSTRLVEMLHSADGKLWLAPFGGSPVHLGLTGGPWETYPGLLFQLRSRDGSDWFISVDDGIVRHRRARWVRYGTEDGAIRLPVRVVEDRSGHVWAGGTDGRSAAVSRFDGTTWETQALSGLSSGIDHRAVYAASSGSVWFGARPEPGGSTLPGGVAEFYQPTPAGPGPWRHHAPPETLPFTYGITEAHGYIWTGGYRGLRRFDGTRWEALFEPRALSEPSLDALHTDAGGDLWVGHRLAGILRYDGVSWRQFGPAEGLPGGRVRALADDGRGGLWASVARRFARFDGATWHADLLPDLPPADGLRSADGELWLVAFEGEWPDRDRSREVPELVSYLRRPDSLAPETRVTRWTPEVGSPGVNGLAWEGRDPWEVTPAARLEFSWRLDAGPWSGFSKSTESVLTGLAPGAHEFEVRARDADFNVDPTPSRVSFTVLPPAWRQPRVLALLALLLFAACWQTLRVVRRDRALRAANEELEQRVDLRTRDLAESRRRLAMAIEAVGMITWDWREAALGWSAGADQLFGLPEGTLASHPNAYRAALSPEDLERLDASAQRVMGGEVDEFQAEVRVIARGAVRWLEVRGGIVADPLGSDARMTGVVLDVTERRVAEEGRRLLIQELEAKNAELERFTYTASHDLKSPLLTIQGFSGRLVDDARAGQLERVAADVSRIRTAAARMGRLLDDLLELSRIGRVVNPSERLDLREVALDAVGALDEAIREAGAQVTVEPLPRATADRTRIVEVFQNLIQNGLKFADPGRSPEIVIGCRAGDEPVITVRDNGIGIEPRYHGRIFDLFERLNVETEGTGIGLALARRIVEHHGGRIWVESEGAGSGSTFCFTLPEIASGRRHT